MKTIELFGGISALKKATINLGIENETEDYIENNPKIVSIRNSIYGTNFKPKTIIDYHYNGDAEIDLVWGSFPCQDISLLGNRKGISNETRSGLIWEQLRIVLEIRPKFYICENVKNLLGKQNIESFKKHNNELEQNGYKVLFKVLNSKEFGIPQNRNRVFIVAIRNDIKSNFNFDNIKTKKLKPLKYFLEKEIKNEYFIYENKHKYISNRINENKIKLINPKIETSIIGTISTQPSRGKMDTGVILEKKV